MKNGQRHGSLGRQGRIFLQKILLFSVIEQLQLFTSRQKTVQKPAGTGPDGVSLQRLT